MDSPFRLANRRRDVDPRSECDAPDGFPAYESRTSISLPSPGFPRSGFPCFDGTMEMCDFLRPSRRTRFPSRDDTRRCVGRFAPVGAERATAGLGFVIRSPLPDFCTGRRSGPPKFLENSLVPMPCSSTPAGPNAPGHTVRRHGPRHVHNEGSHDNPPFEAP